MKNYGIIKKGDNMSELLAPAGNFEALVAAISNGADAIYLGMNQFGARAYATNFDYESLEKAINYAHLRNVKIYVTMNTIVFDEELNDAFNQLKALYELGVDGCIVQDLAIASYMIQNFPQMECHTSTQMGIDDLEGVMLLSKLGAKRVVLSREVPIEKIKEIKAKSSMPIEIFVHGALCVSYSGNCLMSGLIGFRSGNRGRCVGSCRKPYRLINTTQNISYPNSYLLSMKDLSTTRFIKELLVADSLKIEGRMKEPIYVANIVNNYRRLIDDSSYSYKEADKLLAKTFNRTFTKGYLFHEDKRDVTNILKPNNFGYEIGYVSAVMKNRYQITLHDTLNQGDQLRIDSKEEVNFPATKLYDKDKNLINSANKLCYIELKENLNVGDKVYKTKDTKFSIQLQALYPREFRRFPLNFFFSGDIGGKLTVSVSCADHYVTYHSDTTILLAENRPTDLEVIKKQFSRLNDTPYSLNHIELDIPEKSFIPINQLNDIRRICVSLISEKRCAKREPVMTKPLDIKKSAFTISNTPKLSVYCNTLEQYEVACEMGIEIIYYKDNVKRRNHVTYNPVAGPVLVGGYGGIWAYRNQEMISDFSLNVVNAPTVQLLHSLGVDRVTLSHEINKKEIEDLISSYVKTNQGYPNLEMIVYGRADLLFTEYCPLKKMNLCGECKKNQYVLEDEYSYFPIISHDDCTTTILNGKILNLIDDIETIKNINVFRLSFTLESREETKMIIKMFKDKLANPSKTKLFNEKTDTRGHFNKEIL